MSFTITTTEVSHLGFAAIFYCISIGFALLKAVTREEHGPGFWALSFLLNGTGFVLWAGIFPVAPILYYFIGEIFHMGGFLLLIFGIFRFTRVRFTRFHVVALVVFLLLWMGALVGFRFNRTLATIALRILRSGLFVAAGLHILRKLPREKFSGKRLAGISLVLWAIYIVSYGFLHVEALHDFLFGILVGFQVLAAFGLIALVIDRIHIRARESEARVSQLEKLLPVCAHCKKIRDKEDHWHEIEEYVERITESQLSHGICPDCLRTHFSDYANK